MKMQKLSGFGIKDCLTEASLEWKCFRSHNKDQEFYSFNVKYVRGFIRKLIKGWSVAAFITYSESNECEVILKTIKKHLKIKENKNSNIPDEYLEYINNKSDEFILELEITFR